jgi:hypothetical protein
VNSVTAVIVILGATAALHGQPRSRPRPMAADARCAWDAPITAKTIHVENAQQLQQAAREVGPGTTILLEDGEYRLESMVDIAVPHVVVRSRSGDPARVVVRGDGMTERRVGVAISISAPDVTIADLTVGLVGYHGIQIRGERGASRAVVQHVRIIDTGQQLLKGSVAANGLYADDGLVACSMFEYTDHAPSNYINGVDVLAGRGWTVRDNRFERIRGRESEGWAAGPAILFWANSQDTTVERNVVLDSFRGIALGLGPGASAALARGGERVLDHQGGRITNNVIGNLHEWADEGIEVNSARGVSIDHNTVLTEGSLGWSISLRFPATEATVQDNLTSRQIISRNSARGQLRGNVQSARPGWFVDPAGGDFRLTAGAPAAAGTGASDPGTTSWGPAR